MDPLTIGHILAQRKDPADPLLPNINVDILILGDGLLILEADLLPPARRLILGFLLWRRWTPPASGREGDVVEDPEDVVDSYLAVHSLRHCYPSGRHVGDYVSDFENE